MNRTRALIMLLAALAIIVGVFAVIHFTSRDVIPEGALAVHNGDSTRYVNLGLLDRTEVKGETADDAGSPVEIDALGVQLQDVLAAAKVNPQTVTAVTVTAENGTAEITGAELRETGKVFLYAAEHDAAALVVFGDADGARHLTNVTALEVQTEATS